ncbi:MAG: rod shape-determining protein MreC [Nitrospinae bacterium]|nr:rod shape-determining protein MreC [Nitrospinota bacterium]
MPNRRTKGKHFLIILASIVLVSLILMTVNIRHGKGSLFFESVVVWVFSPVQNLFTQTADSISDLFDHYFFLVGVSRENERLLMEIDRLARERNNILEAFKRQARIAKLSETNEGKEIKSVVASVIGRDATQWSKMIFIDKGTDHGIRENASVVTDAGIVGHIIYASAATSKVLLITDSRSAVDSLFQNTRVPGVTIGTGKDLCEMKFVPIEADVKVGDKVLSSGLGGIFPKGRVVGAVVDVVKKKQGLFQDIVVAPSADLLRLEEVLILLSTAKEL